MCTSIVSYIKGRPLTTRKKLKHLCESLKKLLRLIIERCMGTIKTFLCNRNMFFTNSTCFMVLNYLEGYNDCGNINIIRGNLVKNMGLYRCKIITLSVARKNYHW